MLSKFYCSCIMAKLVLLCWSHDGRCEQSASSFVSQKLLLLPMIILQVPFEGGQMTKQLTHILVIH